MPLPGTRVIHALWSAHHRAVAEGQLTATCAVRRPASGGQSPPFDEARGYSVPPDPTTLYEGPCRVQRLQPALSATELQIAGRELVIREYMVVLPKDAVPGDGVAVNDLIVIVECPDDRTLEGHSLRVRDIRQGSLIWQRDLTCEDISPATR